MKDQIQSASVSVVDNIQVDLNEIETKNFHVSVNSQRLLGEIRSIVVLAKELNMLSESDAKVRLASDFQSW